MISTSKINAQVRQIQQFDIAVSNFESKFNYLPGDAPFTGGNGNGNIDISNGSDYLWQGDIYRFWYYLSVFQKLKENNRNYSLSGTPVAGITMPLAKIGDKKTGIIACTIDPTGAAGRTVFLGKPIYGIGGVAGSHGGLYYANLYPTISVSDALAVDKKMDDGVANAGSVRATLRPSGGMGFGHAPDSTAGSGCVMNTNTALYNLSSTSSGPCGLSILMLSTNENSQ